MILTRKARKAAAAEPADPGAGLARHLEDLTARIAAAVEAMPYEVCGHNDRPSCPKCATRLTVKAAAAAVRETGGQP